MFNLSALSINRFSNIPNFMCVYVCVCVLFDRYMETSLQFSSVPQLCPTSCDPINCSMPGFPVHHHLPEFTQTHVHRVGDAIQPFHPLSSPSPPTPNPSQHQSPFQRVNSWHEVAKVLEWVAIAFSNTVQFSSVQFSHSVVSDSLQLHELQHARTPCPSPTPGVHSDSCPLSQ